MKLPLMVFESIKERGCDYKEMFGARCEEHKSAALCEVHQEGYLSALEEPTVISSYSKFQILSLIILCAKNSFRYQIGWT